MYLPSYNSLSYVSPKLQYVSPNLPRIYFIFPSVNSFFFFKHLSVLVFEQLLKYFLSIFFIFFTVFSSSICSWPKSHCLPFFPVFFFPALFDLLLFPYQFFQ
uniref:Uncharacterized protein n=1 Tax=Cacopsylla melanoneura TaxID=428564 RepID=A0A8D8WYI7_9HEMI